MTKLQERQHAAAKKRIADKQRQQITHAEALAKIYKLREERNVTKQETITDIMK